ncbi:MAG: hypothetical protein KKB21_04740 [Nanoarchaeota archaeon]|nr:hypothetical protein [Nanoarchaeota archaeon]MBU4086853.1 hypothetical protein [Nanoarchaeota archaeon]
MTKKEEIKEKSREKQLRKSHEELNGILVENFMHLQRVMSDQASKMDKLSESIAKLLELFEMSARSFMASPVIEEAEKDKEFLEKLNALLEQNKTIAKGLTLMEEKFRERVYGGPHTEFQQPRPMQNSFNPQSQQPGQVNNIKRLPRF